MAPMLAPVLAPVPAPPQGNVNSAILNYTSFWWPETGQKGNKTTWEFWTVELSLKGVGILREVLSLIVGCFDGKQHADYDRTKPHFVFPRQTVTTSGNLFAFRDGFSQHPWGFYLCLLLSSVSYPIKLRINAVTFFFLRSATEDS